MTHLNPIRSALCGAAATLLLAAAARPVAAQTSFNFRAKNAQILSTPYLSLDSVGTDITTANFDDANSAPQSIGFNFAYNGSTFSTFVLNTNGFLRLGSAAPSAANLALTYAQFEYVNSVYIFPGGPLASTDSRDVNIIAPLAVDLSGSSGNGTRYRMVTTGQAPNRVCTIQWKNVFDKAKQATANNSTVIGTQYSSLSFEVKLYEASGQVDFVYGNFTAGPGPDAYRSTNVGLKGNSSQNGELVTVDKASATTWNNPGIVFSDSYYQFSDPFNMRGSVRPTVGNTYRFQPNFANDASLEGLYTLGQIPVGRAHAVRAVVRNSGSQTITNLPVSLSVTGPNTFANTQLISSLAPGALATVTFAPYTVSNQRGNNSVTVSLPTDDAPADNARQLNQRITASTLNYFEPIAGSGITPSFYGWDTRTGVSTVRFTNPTAAVVTDITNFMPTGSNSVGQLIFAALYDATGNLLARTPDYTVRAADLGTLLTFPLPTPTSIPAGSYFVGIGQYASSVVHYPVGYLYGLSTERVVRPNTFYDSPSHTNGIINDRTQFINGPFLIGAVLRPQPVFSSFTPTSGPVGTSVQISGANLNGTTAVTFNGTAAPGFVVDTAGTSLTVAVPTGATTGPIVVTTAGGSATSPGNFTVTAAAPTITSLSPSSGPINAPVDISGTNLGGATSVTFTGNGGPVQANIVLNSTGLIRVNVPTGAISGPVRVTTPAGTAVSPGNFTVQANPVVYSLTPGSGPVGTQVVISGDNFTGALFVSFNQTLVSAQNFTVNSSTQITVNVPAGATTGPVGVNTGGATAFSPNPFTVTTAPGNLTVSSAQNVSGSYQNVTITGTGEATLTGQLKVAGTLTVQSGGTLLTNCQPVRGSGSFALQAGATLGICDAAGLRASSSDTTGAIRLTGSRSFSPDATYRYTGGQAQVTGAGLPAQVRSLEVNKTADLTLSQPVAVAQVLRISGGNLVTNGQMLTLLSSATGTALVDNTGGVVNGTTTVQRYISPALNAGTGYRHLASPVAAAPVSDLATGGFTPVVNPAYNTSATPGLVSPFPTVYGYDQARLASTTNNLTAFDKGWVSPAALTSPLLPGRGYTVNLPAGQLVDFVGSLNDGNQAFSFVRGADAAAGWQLLGNPYPAPLDWSRVAATDRPGLNAALYVFESTGPYTGRYRSYANGIGGNPIVPLGQAFFVRVADGQTSASLTLRNSHRLTAPDATPLLRGTTDLRPQLQLALQGSGPADAAYVYFETGATSGVDAEYDARKLPNTNGLNLAALAGPDALAIAGLPTLTAATVVPLQVAVPAAGAYTLRTEQLLNFAPGTQVLLRDALTNQDIDLQQQTSYSFVHSGAATGRFSLVFRPGSVTATASAQQAAQLTVFPNPTTDAFTLHLATATAGQSARVVLHNALGQVVREQVVAAGATGVRAQFRTAQLPAGVYTLRLTLSDGTLFTKRLIKQ